MRVFILVFILCALLTGIVSIFWYQELQYLLPTPVPNDYQVVLPNEVVKLKDSTLLSQQHPKPKLFHFFSPTCPCSRFNLKHFLSLKRKYDKQVDFYVVIADPKKLTSTKYMLDTDMTILIDKNEMLAKACGVYSTPQAALLQQDNKLYFRGNYNRSRYCTDKNTSFAQMAIDSLLSGRQPPHFIELATQSYGCTIGDQDSTANEYSFFK